MDQNNIHIPVMSKEVVDALNPQSGQFIVDCTLGLGGHASLILKDIGPNGKLIGIDRDSESLELARQRLKEYERNCILIHDDYRNVDRILDKLGIASVDGFVFDLGVSSYQIDSPQRGFSFRFDGPLDMRMDQDSYISAYDLVNALSEKEISYILRNYGQERFHSRIAHRLVEYRSRHPVESTQELREIVVKAIPAKFRNQKIHPATRTFQAIRIAVNRELEALDIVLNKCVDALKPGGRICVISFHSLEDKIVKEKFRSYYKNGTLRLIEKKPLRSTLEETQDNPRSRSARLRVAERT